MEVSTRPHSSQHFDQRAQREARYRGYDIVMQRRDLCRMVTMKPSRPPRVGGSSPSSATNPINELGVVRAPSSTAWVSIWVTTSALRADGSRAFFLSVVFMRPCSRFLLK
jgi:hypothetical protein